MTYIKNDIIFTELKTPHTTNNKLTELQHIKIIIIIIIMVIFKCYFSGELIALS